MSIKKLISMFIALIVCSCALTLARRTKRNPNQRRLLSTSRPKLPRRYRARKCIQTYCAVCHGTDGKGAGPAASALKVPPTDLSALSKNNGGKYPGLKVDASIRGESSLPAHGSKDMPVWGHLFWSMSSGHEGEVQQRVTNLTKYIQSLQAK